jgi:nicotinate-nucleotide pyrophosphorylase (carboxylating)
MAVLPHNLLIDPLLEAWLREDIGRGDRATQGILSAERQGKARWIAKESGIIAGLPLARRTFQLLDPSIAFEPLVAEGKSVERGEAIADGRGALQALLMGERVALNLVMRLSGIATLTRRYVEAIADLPAQLVDTRKTTPGLRILEKYASQVGGAANHRFGLDDSAMIKDNHIRAAGGITPALMLLRQTLPYPLSVEVETSDLAEVEEAISARADLLMLDNTDILTMQRAVRLIRQQAPRVKIEASGNVTLENLRAIAETGVDYISTSAPITRSTWLDLSMNVE